MIRAAVCLLLIASAARAETFDVVIVGGTPGGIMAAVAAARNGRSVVLLERTTHIGGLPANGLGATDIHTRGATAGLFLDFVGRVRKHYVTKYGEKSEQVKACSDGYRFEPHVAEAIFEAMLKEHKITVKRRRQFDSEPENVTLSKDPERPGTVTSIAITELEGGKAERYEGKVFIDATYEGDLAAAAGADYRIGREGKDEFPEPLREPFAGRLYKRWGGDIGPGSDGRPDNAVQAYNYRLCLTRNPDDRVAIEKPRRYDRAEFASLAADIRHNRTTGEVRGEMDWDGIGRVVNMVALPNGKTDANNQHLAFLSLT
jgi:hypothetical protein